MESLRVLAIEPYYGGSHKAFLDGWRQGSRHRWELITLPPSKWKWRMRHSAITCAAVAKNLIDSGQHFDVLFASDMLNLAEFRGLAPTPISNLPALVYFHENQLTYPVRNEKERDLHFAMTNLTTFLAAQEVWFNSSFHHRSFVNALDAFLRRMPDFQPLEAVERIRQGCKIMPQGIRPPAPRGERSPGPLRILWAARWEHDKNPELFFDAIHRLENQTSLDFRLSVVGEQFRDVPEIFAQARESLGHRIDRWGYQESRQEYEAVLSEADVFVSTADHEFFGIAAAEAMAAGCYPLLPKRLAYPELLAPLARDQRRRHLYDGTAQDLANRLMELTQSLRQGEWLGSREIVHAMDRFTWPKLRPKLDTALTAVAKNQPHRMPM